MDVTELRTTKLFRIIRVEGVAFHLGCNHGSQEIMLCENRMQAELMKMILDSMGLNVVIGKARTTTNGDGKRTFSAYPIKVTPSCPRNGTVVVNCHDPISSIALEVSVLQPGVHYTSFTVTPIKDDKRGTGGKRRCSRR